MKCCEKECGGEVDLGTPIMVQTACGGQFGPTHHCLTCGRLHWKDGGGVLNRAGDRAFRDKEGKVYNKNAAGEVEVLA
ncbi:MAG: hypothetical protein NTY66_03950 [Candidatus Vogelbacteria bacterium]|nr:hypothetical protein [Candidatus Vogelbacteria bacterium]